MYACDYFSFLRAQVCVGCQNIMCSRGGGRGGGVWGVLIHDARVTVADDSLGGEGVSCECTWIGVCVCVYVCACACACACACVCGREEEQKRVEVCCSVSQCVASR